MQAPRLMKSLQSGESVQILPLFTSGRRVLNVAALPAFIEKDWKER